MQVLIPDFFNSLNLRLGEADPAIATHKARHLFVLHVVLIIDNDKRFSWVGIEPCLNFFSPDFVSHIRGSINYGRFFTKILAQSGKLLHCRAGEKNSIFGC